MRPERLARIVEGSTDRGARRLPRAPAHPRRARRDGSAERPADRAARLSRHGGARLAGARDRHRLGRPAEGGVLVRRAVRDRAAVDRVGRHGRARRERPRRDDPDALAAAVPAASLPAEAAAALRRRARVGPRRRRSSAANVARGMAYDVAIIGAGYVGLPLVDDLRGGRLPRARRRRRRAVVDGAEPRREPHRGRRRASASSRSSSAD